MISHTTSRFRDALAALPGQIQAQAHDAYALFCSNPQHPGLRFKKVHRSKPIYSVRINIDYRAVGILDGNEVVWFWIGPHDQYEKLLAQL